MAAAGAGEGFDVGGDHAILRDGFLVLHHLVGNVLRLEIEVADDRDRVPGISMSEVPQTTPFVDVYVPGEKAIYDLLNITFIVDEELKSWLEIHDWIRAMTFPKEFEEYKKLDRLNRYTTNIPTVKPQYSDATITLLSSSNTPYYNFRFYDVFPTTLSTFVMSATDSPDTIITADATFRYSYFDVEKLF